MPSDNDTKEPSLSFKFPASLTAEQIKALEKELIDKLFTPKINYFDWTYRPYPWYVSPCPYCGRVKGALVNGWTCGYQYIPFGTTWGRTTTTTTASVPDLDVYEDET